jgi:hypothetical protein
MCRFLKGLMSVASIPTPAPPGAADYFFLSTSFTAPAASLCSGSMRTMK